MTAWYNEIDPYAAQWLRNLIAAGHIAPGVVDERSIIDVRPDDLVSYAQCHFFAGLGGWSHALRLAGWPDDRSVWTGSCPCQPLSVAGQQKGHVDERHLWPAFHRLIAERRPATVFGEQVAGKDGREWLAAVRADLEGDGYACGAADLCAAGAGAPHIRQRLYWMAHADSAGQHRQPIAGLRRAELHDVNGCGSGGGLADAKSKSKRRGQPFCDIGEERGSAKGLDEFTGSDGALCRPGPVNGVWRDADWLYCRDDKWRPVEPGSFPLAHGAASRVGRLRAYGNAIVAPQAETFIEACIDALAMTPFQEAAE